MLTRRTFNAIAAGLRASAVQVDKLAEENDTGAEGAHSAICGLVALMATIVSTCEYTGKKLTAALVAKATKV